jgi:hypothetical protein
MFLRPINNDTEHQKGTPMKVVTKLALLLGVCVAFGSALAQEITPVWVQHFNGVINVADANKLPIFVKPTGNPLFGSTDGTYLDGREVVSQFVRLIPFDATRCLLAIRENGIDEQDPTTPPDKLALAAQYPDHSLIYLELATGKPLGLAWNENLRPADLIGYDVTGAHTGYQSSKLYIAWRPVLDENPDPTKRAIYSGYKHLILRYAPKADGTGWVTTPTIAWAEQVPGLEDDGVTISPAAGIGDGLSGTTATSGEGGSWRSFRWRDFRVSGYGNDTLIYAGGGTWRVGAHPQMFATTNGLNFYPIARVDDRADGEGRRNAFAQGGMSSDVAAYGKDPAHPKVQVVYESHYPGTGWERRPNRYISDPDNPIPSPAYNNQPNVRMFKQNEAETNGLPAFVWQAAGKDGLPIDHNVDGVTRYDGNWNMTLAASSSLDYIVGFSACSYDMSWYSYAWMGIHRMDGTIASGNSSYKIPFKEDDLVVDYANLGAGLDPDLDSTDSWVDLVRDPNAPANQGKSIALVAFCQGGFGVFSISNVAASVTTQPIDVTILAGTTGTVSAVVAGSPNTYRWKKDGVPLSDGRYTSGAKTASLKLYDAVKADAGSYQLEIQNPLSGTSYSTAVKVTVVGAFVRPHQNAALFGAASQISNYGAYGAFLAIDGNTNQTWGGGSIAHTAGDTNSMIWWEVDLKSTLEIARVTYFPRSDCCADRSANVNIVILDASRNEVSRTNIDAVIDGVGFVWPDPWTEDYTPTVNGRYVRIERFPEVPDPNNPGLFTDNVLNIAEVQVFNKFRPTMDIGVYNNQIMIAWDSDAFSTPKLQRSDSLTTGWENVTTTTPYLGPLTGTKFYKLVQGP